MVMLYSCSVAIFRMLSDNPSLFAFQEYLLGYVSVPLCHPEGPSVVIFWRVNL